MRVKYDQFRDEGSLIVLEGTVLDMMEVYEDLDNHIVECGYDVRSFGYDPYYAKEFVERWASENGPFGIEKVPQGARTESVPLGELKKLSEERMLLFDEELMTFTMDIGGIGRRPGVGASAARIGIDRRIGIGKRIPQ